MDTNTILSVSSPTTQHSLATYVFESGYGDSLYRLATLAAAARNYSDVNPSDRDAERRAIDLESEVADAYEEAMIAYALDSKTDFAYEIVSLMAKRILE